MKFSFRQFVRSLQVIASAMLLIGILGAPSAYAQKGSPVTFPAGVNHDAWNTLLKKHVNESGLVAYGAWKDSAADMKALDDYLAQFGKKGTAAKGNELAASAINAYNAFAIRFILANYPTESIMAIDGKSSFAKKTHLVSGQQVSLDDIENGTLRPLIGYRAHAALVCCARSCPPLQRTAYTAGNVNQIIDAAFGAWLGRVDLNKFSPDKNKVEVSNIFKWFKADFEAAGGVPRVLGMHGPEPLRPFLSKGGYKITILPYRWGLNDQGGRGEKYSQANLIFDNVF
jgi:hypothetical protein